MEKSYLLRLSFFSPLVRQQSKCLLMNWCGTLTEHTGQSTAEGRHKTALNTLKKKRKEEITG